MILRRLVICQRACYNKGKKTQAVHRQVYEGGKHVNINLDRDMVYELFQQPDRENFRRLLEQVQGERNDIDFKTIWIEKDKLAKTVLAMANSGGGLIVVGVREENQQLDYVGLEEFKDPADIGNELARYIPDTLSYTVKNYEYSSSEYEKLVGRRFQVLFVDHNPLHAPYIATSAGTYIQNNTIYIRRNTTNAVINNEELTLLIAERIEAQYEETSQMAIKDHIYQLKALYEAGPADLPKSLRAPAVNEDYQQFICRMIEEKQELIRQLLGVR